MLKQSSIKGKSEAWRKAADATLARIAETNRYIMSDMLIAALEEDGNGLDNYSVLGGVFTRAAIAGIIEKTDDQQFSERRKSHSIKTVWKSRIYKLGEPISTEQDAISALVMNALGFNADIIRYASLVFASTPIQNEGKLTETVNEFKRIEDFHQAERVKIIEQLEKLSRKESVDESVS